MLEPFKYPGERKSHQSFNEVYFRTSVIKDWKQQYPTFLVMRLSLISIIAFLLLTLNTFGQTRIISGKVMDEHLDVIPQVRIQNSDTMVLGETGIDGKFKIEIPVNTTSLLIGGIGYEWASINLPTDCDHLDILLMAHTSYDFITLEKVNRLRRKRFKKLSGLHLTAYKKGIFITDKPCYKQTFIPIK